jgi:hypothetical protein
MDGRRRETKQTARGPHVAQTSHKRPARLRSPLAFGSTRSRDPDERGAPPSALVRNTSVQTSSTTSRTPSRRCSGPSATSWTRSRRAWTFAARVQGK